ncbi:HEPN domain-containing protein [Streptomyces sp. CBMA123]|uniref:HEPN domain-containing protein n=1 Tax=Streptomyces sp. CBMA123 TaxID=1896313 RepID=UPI001661C2DC|nr:HEPN domain-containing protein [Streptomyces sp. CBMA123]
MSLNSESIPAGRTEVEKALVQIALDAYPAFLFPLEPDPVPIPVPMLDLVNRHVTALLFRHPAASRFSDAVLQDSVFKQVFTYVNEHVGYVANVFRNTGNGGGVQLPMLPDMLVRHAWAQMDKDAISPGDFAKKVLQELHLVRAVFAGKSRSATAFVGLTGVLLPPGIQLAVGNILIRSIEEKDKQFIPPGIQGKLAGTDAAGVTTTISYEGDLVMETEFPYKVRIIPEGIGLSDWPEDLQPPKEIEQALIRLRFAMLLAVEREGHRPQIVPTWRIYDEPIKQGFSASWNDSRRTPSLVPTQLSEEEVTAWQEWYERLSDPSAAKIELAMTRILRAIAERREPSDVLIDSVIAWENLFGTKEGEPTFRITSCLAKLLCTSGPERLELRRELGKIYGLRSDIVHGASNLEVKHQPRCQEALDIAIKAIKILVSERQDILAEKDGALRSVALLLGD